MGLRPGPHRGGKGAGLHHLNPANPLNSLDPLVQGHFLGQLRTVPFQGRHRVHGQSFRGMTAGFHSLGQNRPAVHAWVQPRVQALVSDQQGHPVVHPGGLRGGLRRQDGGRQQPGLARSGTPPGVESCDIQRVAVGGLEVVGLVVRCPLVVAACRNDGPLTFGRVRVGPLGQGALHPRVVGGVGHLVAFGPGWDQVPAGRMQVPLPMSVLGHQGYDRPGADVPGGLGQSRSLPGTVVLSQT